MATSTLLMGIGAVMIVMSLIGWKVIGYGETVVTYDPDGGSTTELWWGHIIVYLALLTGGAGLLTMGKRMDE